MKTIPTDIIIPTPPITNDVEANTEINALNARLKDTGKLLVNNLTLLTPEDIQEDGYHINEKAAAKIATAIRQKDPNKTYSDALTTGAATTEAAQPKTEVSEIPKAVEDSINFEHLEKRFEVKIQKITEDNTPNKIKLLITGDKTRNCISTIERAAKKAQNDAEGQGASGNKSPATPQRPEPCKFFQKGKCTKGINCPHLHQKQPQTCTYYEKTGECRYGDNCKYSHPPSSKRARR